MDLRERLLHHLKCSHAQQATSATAAQCWEAQTAASSLSAFQELKLKWLNVGLISKKRMGSQKLLFYSTSSFTNHQFSTGFLENMKKVHKYSSWRDLFGIADPSMLNPKSRLQHLASVRFPSWRRWYPQAQPYEVLRCGQAAGPQRDMQWDMPPQRTVSQDQMQTTELQISAE